LHGHLLQPRQVVHLLKSALLQDPKKGYGYITVSNGIKVAMMAAGGFFQLLDQL
jgi:hypothetical protein